MRKRYLLERLERRALLSAVSWDGGGDGTNWSDPLNWSTNAVPGAADDVTIDVPGSLTVLVRGSVSAVQSLVNRETLWLRGDNTFGTVLLTTSGNITNDGTIQLESIDSSWTETLTAGGVLTNSATGVIQVNAGTGGSRLINGSIDNSGTINASNIALTAGAGGKTFNQLGGTVTASGANGRMTWSTGTMNFSGGSFVGPVYLSSGSLSVASTAGAQTILVQGASTLLSNDSTSATVWVQGNSIASSASLAIPGNVTNNGTIRIESIDSSWTETLNIGGVLTNSASGVIQVNAGTGGTRAINGNIDNSGTINISNIALTAGAAGKTLNQLAGTVTASGTGTFSWSTGTMNFSGGSFVGSVYVNGGSLSVASTAGAQTILVQGSSTLLSNDSTAATVWVQGNGIASSATLAIGNVTNKGTLRLESIDSTYTETLNITGVLTNASTGVIQVNTGSGGSRQINGNIDNSGTINTQVALTAGAAGKTFNQLGGTVTASGSGSFTWSTGTLNFSGGSFVGAVYLSGGSLSVASTAGAQTILVEGSSTLINNLSTAATVWVQGNSIASSAQLMISTATNDGTILLESADSSYSETMTITGLLTNASSGVIQAVTGTGGSRLINGNITNNGTITADINVTMSGNLDNNGTISTSATLGAGANGKTFNQNAGSITASGVNGRFTWSTGAMNFNGGSLTGPVGVNNGTLSVASTAGAQTILLQGNSTLLSCDSTAATVWVQGNSIASSAAVTITSLTNKGTLRLESVDSSYSETLNTSGVLTNAATGVIQINTGTGGSRLINGNIDNSGTINTNMAVMAGATGKTFNQLGGTVTASGSGSFVWSTGTLNFAGGSFVGTVYLNSGSLSVASTAGAQSILVRGNSTLLSNDSTAATVWVQGNGTTGTTQLAIGTVTNNGTILLQSIDSSYSETLAITGALTNASTGVIQVNAGTGGSRFINGPVTNQGLISFVGAIDLNGTGTITNTGTIQRTDAAASNFAVSLLNQGTGLVNVAAGTIRFTGTTNIGSGTFLSGGTYHVANGATLGFGSSPSQRPTVNTADIAITGTGVAEIDKLMTNRGEIELLGGNDLTVTPMTGGVLTNEGIIDLSPDSIFSVTGNMNFAGTSQPVIHSEIASATSFGKLTVSGTFNLDSPSSTSRFDPDLVGAYDPPLGATFNVITANPASNGFDSFQGGLTPSNNVLELTRPDANTVQVKIGPGPLPPAPQILNETYEYETRQAIVFTFNQDVSAFLSRKDYLLQNLTTSQTVPSSAGTLSYNLNSNQATLTLTNQLPDGNYKLTVSASDIANSAGVPASGAPIILNFFVLRGDANHDAKVDVGDLGTLATNYGLTNKTFSQGDFNYDTKVDVGDLGILATNYGVNIGGGPSNSAGQANVPIAAPTAMAAPKPVSAIDAALHAATASDLAWPIDSQRRDLLNGVGLE